MDKPSAGPTDAPSVHELTRRAQAGDRKAFAVLYDRFHEYVKCGFLSVGLTHDESWDLTQETFIHAFRGIHTLRLDDRVNMGGWLRQIGTNLLRKMAKRRAKVLVASAVGEFMPEIPDPTGAPPEHGEFAREDYRALHACLDVLGIEHRRLVLYRFVYRWSGRRIAKVVGSAESTVRLRLNEALADLRDCLTKKGVALG